MIISSVILVVVSVVTLLSADFVAGDEVYWIQASTSASDAGIEIKEIKLSNERQSTIPAYLTKISNPGKNHVMPVPGSKDGCTRVQLNKIAEDFECTLAVNGAPFNMDDGSCIGNLISNGTIYSQQGQDDVYPSFAITTDGRLGFGNITPEMIDQEGITNVISGFQNTPLLVENGVPFVSGDTKIAQRQAIGVTKEGELLFLTVDGAEARDRGMTITELAVAMVQVNAFHAVNIDGGGSTALWMDGSYVDRPTCTDNVFPSCDRAVANAICVLP